MARFVSPQRLRAAREKAGLRREVVAVSMRRSHATIVAYERPTGWTEPPARVLLQLAELYGCSIEDFIADEEEPEAVAQ